jgi:hypothetical protein
MRDLSEININDGGRPVTRPPPSPATIAAYEREFGVILPTDYVTLLLHSNGGGPEVHIIRPLADTNSEGEGVNRFFFLDESRDAVSGLWWETRTMRPYIGQGKVPIADNGVGDVYVLDMNTAPPKVTLSLHEEDYREIDIARSFEDFIDRLEYGEDMI